jgi:hypothetical protein
MLNFLVRLILAWVLGTMLLATAARATPPSTISASAAVCDPWSPQECARPGGHSTTGNIAANDTVAVVVKASPGIVYGVQLGNIGAVPGYLKLYDATSATCGTGTPVKRLQVPAAATAANGASVPYEFGLSGVKFSTGITYCFTAGLADSDTTAPAASSYLINIDWK